MAAQPTRARCSRLPTVPVTVTIGQVPSITSASSTFFTTGMPLRSRSRAAVSPRFHHQRNRDASQRHFVQHQHGRPRRHRCRGNNGKLLVGLHGAQRHRQRCDPELHPDHRPGPVVRQQRMAKFDQPRWYRLFFQLLGSRLPHAHSQRHFRVVAAGAFHQQLDGCPFRHPNDGRGLQPASSRPPMPPAVPPRAFSITATQAPSFATGSVSLVRISLCRLWIHVCGRRHAGSDLQLYPGIVAAWPGAQPAGRPVRHSDVKRHIWRHRHRHQRLGGSATRRLSASRWVEPPAAFVQSINGTSPSNLNAIANTVSYTVTFSEAVTGVAAAGFPDGDHRHPGIDAHTGNGKRQCLHGNGERHYGQRHAGIEPGRQRLHPQYGGRLRSSPRTRPVSFQPQSTFAAGFWRPIAIAVRAMSTATAFRTLVTADLGTDSVGVQSTGNGNGTFQAAQHTYSISSTVRTA